MLLAVGSARGQRPDGAGHARTLLTSTPQGACDYVDGDLRDPDKILAEAARTLDFAQPVALMLLGILHHIPDTGEAYWIVRRLVAALAPGSFVAINHSASAIHGAAMEEAVAHWNQVGTPSMEPGRHAVDDLAHPRADRPLFRRPGPAATRGGVVFTLAARPQPW